MASELNSPSIYKKEYTMLWKNYFFTSDFSDVSDYLSNIATGFMFANEDAEVLAGFLQDHDPHEKNKGRWCARRPEQDFSTDGAKVTYNGPNTEFMPTNSKFTHVMTIDFSHTECDEPSGKVHLHYNL